MAPKAKAKAGSNSGNGGVPMSEDEDEDEDEVLAWGDESMLCRPCVDCGVKTVRFCAFCHAADRVPSEEWADGQMTPLCSRCDWAHGECHFCRGLSWCMPHPQQFHGTAVR